MNTYLMVLFVVPVVISQIVNYPLNILQNVVETKNDLDTDLERNGIPSIVINTTQTDYRLEEQIELTSLPVHFVYDSNVTLNVKYNSLNAKQIFVKCYYQDTFGQLMNFYKKQIKLLITEDIFNHNIEIPSQIVYFDRQKPGNPTNYFVSTFDCTGILMGVMNDELAYDTITLDLLPPWSRKDLPTYCKSWSMQIQNVIENLSVPSCSLLSDINLFPFVLPLSATTAGFSRMLGPIQYPQHVTEVNEKIKIGIDTTRFSLSFWFFITHECTFGLCILIQHRNSKQFLTPVILLNNERRLHIQLHSEDGSGHAFTSIDKCLLNTWTHVTLVVTGKRADIHIWVPSKDYRRHYHHISRQDNYLNVSDGTWSVGGSGNENSLEGFFGYGKLFQNVSLKTHHITKNEDLEPLNKMLFEEYFQKCDVLKSYLWHDVLKKSKKATTCSVKAWWCSSKKSNNLCSLTQYKKQKMLLQENQIVEIMEVVLTSYQTKRNDDSLYTLFNIGKLIHETAEKHVMKEPLSKSVAARLFEMAGCFGFKKGYHMAATIFKYGLGVPVNNLKALQMQLLGSHQNYPLSHLALAYRHQLGVDGVKQDIEIVAAYLKQVALIGIQRAENEDHQVFTQSEMIRLDHAHLFRDVRGSDSHLFTWLSQQAKMGSFDATGKIAEMLFHGKQGVNANQAQALEYYQMAADGGNLNAIYNIGVMHMKGVMVEKNESKAFEYFQKAASQNSSLAYNSLGFIEYHKNNLTGAMHYWKTSADLDNPEGLTNYAAMLESGVGPTGRPDKVLAFEFYKKAAEKGQKNACMRVASILMNGDYVSRDVISAVRYYRYVAEQVSDVGLCMRDAIDSYLEENWYKSLINHLLATESGIQLAGYNTALLLEEYENEISNLLGVNKPFYFYNFTAELGWSLSLIEMGNRNWFAKDEKKASRYYARSIQKDNNPEALYSLGYIVEYNYPIADKILFANMTLPMQQMSGNFTIALILYQSCIDTKTENGEGYYPCIIAKTRLLLKVFILENTFILGLVCGIIVLFVISVRVLSKFVDF